MSAVNGGMVNAEILAAIAGIVGDANVITDAEGLRAAFNELSLSGSAPGEMPGDIQALLRAVIKPRSETEVSDLVRLAREHGFALVTAEGMLGAGRESVFLDLRHLNRITNINRTNLTVDVQAGVTLEVLEERLNRDQLTLGPLPHSVMGSSVSEWLGGRSAFFPTARYGNWIDLVLALSGVLASGEVFQSSRTPRNAVGPDLDHLIIGGRGLLAVITGATLCVHAVPAWSRVRAFIAPDFAAGLEAIRAVCQSGNQPALARLLDSDLTDTIAEQAGIEPGGALLLLGYEGEDSALSRLRAKKAFHLAASACRELPAAEAEKCLAASCGVVSPWVEFGVMWSHLPEFLRALADIKEFYLVYADAHGVVLGGDTKTLTTARDTRESQPDYADLLRPLYNLPIH